MYSIVSQIKISRSYFVSVSMFLGFFFRLAFSCIWEMTWQAEIIDTRFTKSVIRSKVGIKYWRF